MWVFLLGCSNSGLDLGSTSGETGGSPAGLQDCPWVGEWELETISCGNFPFDTDWDDAGYDGATMAIAHDPAGGCAVVTTVRGDECRREEAWHMALPEGIDVALESEGITDCVPAGCQFNTTEAACANGELAGAFAVRIEEVTPGTLTALNLIPDTATPECPLDVNSTWKKE